ncbi:MAG: sulfotransferase [Candidatus Limnocylindrales bacterium]
MRIKDAFAHLPNRKRDRPATARSDAARSATRRAEPAPPPPGFVIGPPDFVGVGAQKAGTTWWFRLIEAHPGVYQSPDQRPELHFFDRFHEGWLTPADIERYHRHFPRPPGMITGEKTPEYLADHWVPRMLREAAPDCRIIVLLRDPIERYRSAHAHDDQRESLSGRRAENDMFQRGFYARQLERLHGSFAPERVLVLQYERCVAEPAAQLARTYQFLDLPPHAIADEELRLPRNRTRAEKADLPAQRRSLLRDEYEPDVRALRAIVPDLDLSLWPDFAHLAEGDVS